MSGPPTIETLPLELTTKILEDLDGRSTLSAAVHASPELHAIYRGAREMILTKITLVELANRHVDIFQPFACFKLTLRDESISGLILEEGLVSARVQRKEQIRARKAGAGNIPKIKLSPDECYALLQLDDFLAFDFNPHVKACGSGAAAFDSASAMGAMMTGLDEYYGLVLTDSPAALNAAVNFFVTQSREELLEQFKRLGDTIIREVARRLLNKIGVAAPETQMVISYYGDFGLFGVL